MTRVTAEKFAELVRTLRKNNPGLDETEARRHLIGQGAELDDPSEAGFDPEETVNIKPPKG